jgi:hypothetical protein
MKGTDVTPEQLAHAESFLRETAAPVPVIGAKTILDVEHLIRLLAWYGAIRAKNGNVNPGRLVTRAAEEAQADATRLRKERDSALSFLRVIGRLATDERIVSLCKAAVGGEPGPDTARLDAVESQCADIELTCGGVWRVSGLDRDYEADSLRDAIDQMVATCRLRRWTR